LRNISTIIFNAACETGDKAMI